MTLNASSTRQHAHRCQQRHSMQEHCAHTMSTYSVLEPAKCRSMHPWLPCTEPLFPNDGHVLFVAISFEARKVHPVLIAYMTPYVVHDPLLCTEWSSLQAWPALRYLSLERCFLAGSLPAKFSQPFAHLEHLSLSYNALSGMLPAGKAPMHIRICCPLQTSSAVEKRPWSHSLFTRHACLYYMMI